MPEQLEINGNTINLKKRVKTVEELGKLASQKKSVVVVASGYTGHRGYQPAAWVLNYPGSLLLRLIHGQGIYLFEGYKRQDN